MAPVYLGMLLLLSAIWGASFLFIKIGVSEMGPLTFSMLRVLIGSLGLLAIVRAQRLRLPRDPATWRRYALMGLIGVMIPFTLIGWGTQRIASGLSAILNATMPLFTFLLAVVWGDERLSVARIAGVLLGFCGIVVLTYPQLVGGLRAALLGQAAVILASLAYAGAAVYARGMLRLERPIVAALGQVFTAFLIFVPASLVEQPWTVRPSLQATLALLALGLLGTSWAYILYYRLIQGVGATATSLVTYIVPVFGVFWGWLILGERLSWHAFAALALILIGMVCVNGPPHLQRATPAALTEAQAE